MTREQLKKRVRDLPQEPGIYMMKNDAGDVIYVGKAKRLRSRVSNYFQPLDSLNAKTRQLVGKIDHFDIIVTDTEFEALVLENAMIKKYQPRYNILLKDDKGYPYIRIDDRLQYPEFKIVSKPSEDGAKYFGPYASRRSARQAIDAVNEALALKTCTRVFPRDIGKERPCLNQHLGKCCAPCTGELAPDEYQGRIKQAVRLFAGDSKALRRDIETRMQEAAEGMQFERAAVLRDQMRAIEKLSDKQHIVAGAFNDVDAVGYVQGQTRAAVCVLHYAGGVLQDKEYAMFRMTESNADEVLSAFLKQYYAARGAVPETVLLSAEIEESALIAQYLTEIGGRRVQLQVPQRGKWRVLAALAEKNAFEEIERHESKHERRHKSLELLQKVTGMQALPLRLEAYDISNLAGQDTIGAMVTFVEGKPYKAGYRKFKIAVAAANGQDDYGAMEEMLIRRVQRYVDGDEKFSPLPNAFLIDGGLGHVRVCQKVLDAYDIETPCFGMVKDDKHRTRALIAPDGREFGIAATPALFALLGRIQEEVHRYAIGYNRQLRTGRIRGSTLDDIPGVGEKRRVQLLKYFGTISAIREASLEELLRILPRNAADAVYGHFHKNENGEERA